MATVSPGFEPVRGRSRPRSTASPTWVRRSLSGTTVARPVVDLWGGIADSEQAGMAGRHASVIFSCTKGLSAILAARLVQEGRLDYDAPVADYWPEFAAAGKAAVRVKDLLVAPVRRLAPRAALTRRDVLDWDGRDHSPRRSRCGSRAPATPTTRSPTVG